VDQTIFLIGLRCEEKKSSENERWASSVIISVQKARRKVRKKSGCSHLTVEQRFRRSVCFVCREGFLGFFLLAGEDFLGLMSGYRRELVANRCVLEVVLLL
jgi:hypothetical protein